MCSEERVGTCRGKEAILGMHQEDFRQTHWSQKDRCGAYIQESLCPIAVPQKLHILRGGEGVATHYTDQWVSYLVMETAQGYVKGLPGDGGKAQQESHIILVGTETGGVSATFRGNPHLEIVLSVQPSDPSKSQERNNSLDMF